MPIYRIDFERYCSHLFHQGTKHGYSGGLGMFCCLGGNATQERRVYQPSLYVRLPKIVSFVFHLTAIDYFKKLFTDVVSVIYLARIVTFLRKFLIASIVYSQMLKQIFQEFIVKVISENQILRIVTFLKALLIKSITNVFFTKLFWISLSIVSISVVKVAKFLDKILLIIEISVVYLVKTISKALLVVCTTMVYLLEFLKKLLFVQEKVIVLLAKYLWIFFSIVAKNIGELIKLLPPKLLTTTVFLKVRIVKRWIGEILRFVSKITKIKRFKSRL